MGATGGVWDDDGVWLKTALHTHTSDTDGEFPPRAVAEHYEWAGFDVLAITDHWTLTSVPSTEHLLVITGAELAVDPLGEGRYTEILAIGSTRSRRIPAGIGAYWERIDNYEFKTFPDLSTAATFITGPGRSGVPGPSLLERAHPRGDPGAEGLTGLELFNASSDREAGRGDSSYLGPGAGGRPRALGDRHRRQSLPAVRRRRRVDHGARRGSITRRGPGRVASAAQLCVERSDPARRPARRRSISRSDAARADRWNCTRATRKAGRSAPITGDVSRARGSSSATTPASWFARRSDPSEDLPFVRVVATDARGRSAWTNPL